MKTNIEKLKENFVKSFGYIKKKGYRLDYERINNSRDVKQMCADRNILYVGENEYFLKKTNFWCNKKSLVAFEKIDELLKNIVNEYNTGNFSNKQIKMYNKIIDIQDEINEKSKNTGVIPSFGSTTI